MPLDWIGLRPQIEALADHIAARNAEIEPETGVPLVMYARRLLHQIGYEQAGIQVVGEFALLSERTYVLHHPEQYAAYMRHLNNRLQAGRVISAGKCGATQT